ncbi:MAG: hypothetical protein AB8C46_22160 [Burkholderiaceae bacterium]
MSDVSNISNAFANNSFSTETPLDSLIRAGELQNRPENSQPNALPALPSTVQFSPDAGLEGAIALSAKIQEGPASTRELFDLLAQGVQASGEKLTLIDLGVMETDIRGDGSLVLKFSNGQIMGLDAFIREAVGRGLLTTGGEVQVPIDRHEMNEAPGFAAWAIQVTADTGVGIAAYQRAGEPEIPSVTI